MKKIFIVLLSVLLLATATNTWAARKFGGGKSFGHQSNNVSKRETQRATPSQQNTAPTQAPAATQPKRQWGAMLGGLAAGLGLAWLASKLGLGGALANIMLIVLAVVVIVAIIGFIRRRKNTNTQSQNQAPFATQNAARAPSSYLSENVGNDASARPWEQSNITNYSSQNSSANQGSMIGSALSGSQSWGIPVDFDTNGFIQSAKDNFLALQKAWDMSDTALLRTMMTDDVYFEIKKQIDNRGMPAAHPTETLQLQATLLGIETLPTEYLASVEFTGMTREAPNETPTAFREVWNLSKATSGKTGWLVAGLQVME